MEIGSSRAGEDSDVWVCARQYTGRIVTVSNKAFFDEPIYNYSKDFEYVWEEIVVPVSYTTHWEKGRDILLEKVEEATRSFREESAGALTEMSQRYLLQRSEVEPRVFVRLTDNWIELAARFVLPTRSARQIKSAISESVLKGFSQENVTIASTTSEIVGFPLCASRASRRYSRPTRTATTRRATGGGSRRRNAAETRADCLASRNHEKEDGARRTEKSRARVGERSGGHRVAILSSS